MGEQDVKAAESEGLRSFVQALLEDVRALERMIEEGRIESGVRRIGAELEMFLVDDHWDPVPKGPAVLARLGKEFTPELATFNIEANLTPQPLAGDCLRMMEQEMDRRMREARAAANEEGAMVLLCGILPTLRQSDLTIENMVNTPRFRTFNKVMKEMVGGQFRTLIKGLDELQVTHDNVMLEACTTSFQLHFQVAADEFAKLYNLAQLVTGPVLASACNSPVLLQHRLWHETRVALFAQSLDVRSDHLRERGKRQRVTFGDDWIKEGVIEIFKSDVARFRALLATNLDESSIAVLDRGEIPRLKALCLHNGTVYRWNRPCYGVTDGVPHLRIENRVLPAGPTEADMIAGAAFYFGLMVALGEEYGDVTRVMSFDDAKHNFLHAARYGLHAQFRWINGREETARDLILDELLPLAEEGLREKKIPTEDIDRYIGILRERIERGRNGAQWALESLNSMGSSGNVDGRHRALTQATYRNQLEKLPVHKWPLATYEPGRGDLQMGMKRVSQIMTRDVFSVHPEDVLELAASLMDWEHIRRIPVEDDQGNLVGLLSQRGLLRMLLKGRSRDSIAVSEVMRVNPITCTPEMTTLAAMKLMRDNRLGCLPVVEGRQLVGIVTEHDFLAVAASLLEDALAE
ncbi:MAG: CBS domain-containing protein [Planctomycetota bacterium]|nr:CBS domain-containing protein [Planctomycetota bacterium]